MNFRLLAPPGAETPIFPKENKGFREGSLFTKKRNPIGIYDFIEIQEFHRIPSFSEKTDALPPAG